MFSPIAVRVDRRRQDRHRDLDLERCSRRPRRRGRRRRRWCRPTSALETTCTPGAFGAPSTVAASGPVEKPWWLSASRDQHGPLTPLPFVFAGSFVNGKIPSLNVLRRVHRVLGRAAARVDQDLDRVRQPVADALRGRDRVALELVADADEEVQRVVARTPRGRTSTSAPPTAPEVPQSVPSRPQWQLPPPSQMRPMSSSVAGVLAGAVDAVERRRRRRLRDRRLGQDRHASASSMPGAAASSSSSSTVTFADLASAGIVVGSVASVSS